LLRKNAQALAAVEAKFNFTAKRGDASRGQKNGTAGEAQIVSRYKHTARSIIGARMLI